jgi:hypothetical protein
LFSDIGDCSTGACLNGGTCVDGIHSFTCTCADGFSGNTCEIGKNTISLVKHKTYEIGLFHGGGGWGVIVFIATFNTILVLSLLFHGEMNDIVMEITWYWCICKL